jgi:Kef-type K+ transport system membrane component KefB
MLDASLATITIQPVSFLIIVVVSAVAGTLAAVIRFRSIAVPAVVLELFLGILIGPHLLGLQLSPFIKFFSDLGLGLLFFFAGYELDLQRIAGRPLRLGVAGWTVSLALAYGFGAILQNTGVILSEVYVGSALATTAIGTLLPIISDAGELRTRLGTFLLAAGAVGEFGPILLVTLILSAESTVHNALILLAFVAVVVMIALFTVRSSGRTVPVLLRTLESSAQLAVRWALVLIFALALLASRLGLDLLLGGFAAGMITRALLKDQEMPAFDSKLSAVGFGIFVPFFFVYSGMKLDVAALFASPGDVGKLALFFVLFLLVRGLPVLFLYRNVLPPRERTALGFLCSTQLPMVVAITDLATSSGHMLPSTAAALVGAATLSTLVFPIVGLKIKKGAPQQPPMEIAADPPSDVAVDTGLTPP